MISNSNLKQITKSVIPFILCCVLVIAMTILLPIKACAEDLFSVKTDVVTTTSEETLKIRFTISNDGKDFEGYCRFSLNDATRQTTVFDTPISLPSGTVKQFTLEIPSLYMRANFSETKLHMVDKKGKILQTVSINPQILKGTPSINVGILSNNYTKLTYFDLGNYDFEIFGDNYPIKLNELNQDNFNEYLSSLHYLVIDNYNTSVLSDEQIAALNSWVNGGGILFLGTGSHGNDVVSPAISSMFSVELDSSANPNQLNDYIYNLPFDISKLTFSTFSNLDYAKGYYFPERAVYITYFGNGGVFTYAYSFSDLPNAFDTDHIQRDLWDYVDYLYEEAARQTSPRFLTQGAGVSTIVDDDLSNYLTNLSNLDNTLSFNALLFILFIYLLLLSPLTYLILKKTGKQETYWLFVPVLSFIFVIIIYFAGNGFKVQNTKAYSLTFIDSDGRLPDETALLCFSPRKNPYNISVSERFKLSCPVPYNYGSYANSTDTYTRRLILDEGGFTFEQKPIEPFQSYHYYLRTEDTHNYLISFDGNRITNNSGYDFDYIGIINTANNDYRMIDGCKDGETVSSTGATIVKGNTRNMVYDYSTAMRKNKDNIQDFKALFAALASGDALAEYNSSSNYIVFGIISDYEKVTGNKNEKNYACVFSFIN